MACSLDLAETFSPASILAISSILSVLSSLFSTVAVESLSDDLLTYRC